MTDTTDTTDIVERLRDIADRLEAACVAGQHEVGSVADCTSPALRSIAIEIEALRARVAELQADHTAALDLVARVRVALGDNGRRMQDDLLEWCKELRQNDARYRWLRDGEACAKYPYPVMRMGGDSVLDDRSIWFKELDAAIDAAMKD